MAVKPLLTVNGTYRRMNKSYLTVNSMYRKVKKAYETVNGKYVLRWSSGLERIGETVLTVARSNMGAASFADYALFAGGGKGSTTPYRDTVDAYTNSGVNVSAESLSYPRCDIVGASDADRAFFGGGTDIRTANTRGTNIDAYSSNLVKDADCPSLPAGKGRASAAGAVLGGNFFIGGGMNTQTYAFYDDVYMLKHSPWDISTTGKLLAKSYRCAAARGLNHVLFSGGITSTEGTPHAKVSAFDANCVRFDGVATLKNSKYLHAGARICNGVIFAGGSSATSPYMSVDVYNEALTKIDGVKELSAARYSLSAVPFGDYVLFVGGRNSNNVLSTIDVYDKNCTKIEDAGIALSVARFNLASSATRGKVFVAGGQPANSETSSVVDIFSE